MRIYVPEEDMPKSCLECNLAHGASCYCVSLLPHVCRPANMVFPRHKDCELIPLALIHTGSLSRVWEEKLHPNAATVKEES